MPFVHNPKPFDLSDEGKTREQLLSELRELRARMIILENIESDSKHAKEALVISEQQGMGIDAMLESIAAGVVIYDSSGSIVRMNGVAMDFFQYSLDQYRQPVQQRGERLQMCKIDGTPYLPDELPYARVMKGDIIRDEEMIVNLSSGKTVWLSATLSPIRVKNSAEIIGIVFVFADITERKRMEEALRRSHDELEQRVGERTVELQRLNDDLITQSKIRRQAEESLRESVENFRAAFEQAAIGITYVRKDGCFMRVNRKFCIITGFTSEELVKMNVGDITYHPDRADELILMNRLLTGELTTFSSEKRYVRKDGAIVWVNLTVTPIFHNGTLAYLMGMTEDITKRKKAEEELKEAKMHAELYLDLMGHDISNMHQIAMGQLELANEIMCEKGGLKFDEKELIETPLETLNRSARLIENVRNLQKMNKGEYSEETIDLNDLLSNIVKEYEFILPANSIKFVGNGQSNVRANKLLRDVFVNLIGNAIKHSNGASIDVNIKLENINSNSENYYRIVVEDTGPGIPDDMKDKVFNRLQRGGTKARGLGLGLYLVKSLVDSYGGCVWAEDRVEGDHTKGTKFVVMLPTID